MFVPQVRISSISRIDGDRSIRQLQATGLLPTLPTLPRVPLSLAFAPSTLTSSMTQSRTDESLPPALFFSPLLSTTEEGQELALLTARGFSCVRTQDCCTMRRATPGPLCDTGDSFFLLLSPPPCSSDSCPASVARPWPPRFLPRSRDWKDLSDLNSFADSQWPSVFQLVGDHGKRCLTPGFSFPSPPLSSAFCLCFPFLPAPSP